MTKENNEINFQKLNELITDLELKEAIENGDMGKINFYLKHITFMLRSLTELNQKGANTQKKILENNMKQIGKTNAALLLITDQFSRYEKLIFHLVERVTALEEAKN